jgi:hypothetical protein
MGVLGAGDTQVEAHHHWYRPLSYPCPPSRPSMRRRKPCDANPAQLGYLAAFPRAWPQLSKLNTRTRLAHCALQFELNGHGDKSPRRPLILGSSSLDRLGHRVQCNVVVAFSDEWRRLAGRCCRVASVALLQ